MDGNPRAIDRISGLVTETDFGTFGLGKLFAALVMLHDSGHPICDPVVLIPKLESLGVPQEVRTPAFIANLFDEGVIGHERYYADQIRKMSVKRQQLILAGALQARAVDPKSQPADDAEWMIERLQSLASGHDVSSISIYDAGCRALDELNEAARSASPRGVMSGLQSMDDRHGAWKAGDLIILAARPGVGKTSLALRIKEYPRQQRPLGSFIEHRDHCSFYFE